MKKLVSHDEFVKFIDEVSVSLSSKIKGLAGPFEELFNRAGTIDSDLTKLTEAISNIAEAESRVARLEKIHRESGLAKDYPGTGWYKATDTGVVYNKDVPAGETYKFEGDPVEYISVWRNEGVDPETYTGSAEDAPKLLEWHKNLHRYATSNVTDMGYWMFGYGNSALYDEMSLGPADISHFDTSNVTNMEYMFAAAAPSFNQPLDNLDTSNVTNMFGMFQAAEAFNQPLDNFDTSNVTNMGFMFYGAKAFNQPLDNFDTSKVTDMGSMFFSASSFNQDISSWDTSSVENMEYMFRYAAAFNQDLSQWCVPLVTTEPEWIDRMASSWTLPRPVWGTCPRGEDGSNPKTEPADQGLAKDYPGTGWYKAIDTGIVYNKDIPEGETYIFEGDPTEYISVWRNEGFNPETFTNSAESIQKAIYWHKNLNRFATSNVTDMSYWMYGYGHEGLYDSLGISPDTINTDSIDISHYDTSNVTNMKGMFQIALGFNQPLDNFNTSNVTNLERMFQGALSFNQDLSGWCVPHITTAATGFDANTPNWTLPRPVWGTCPRGEDQA